MSRYGFAEPTMQQMVEIEAPRRTAKGRKIDFGNLQNALLDCEIPISFESGTSEIYFHTTFPLGKTHVGKIIYWPGCPKMAEVTFEVDGHTKSGSETIMIEFGQDAREHVVRVTNHWDNSTGGKLVFRISQVM